MRSFAARVRRSRIELLELTVGRVEQRSAGRLVDSAGLHPDKPVFDEVDSTDAVLARRSR